MKKLDISKMKLFDNIFDHYGEVPSKLSDRIELKTSEEPVDVIIPLINTNTLFRRNLYSYYEEIPINRILIGDGGITDDSLEILEDFPRVKVLDHKHMKSQGGSIVDLIQNVETKFFVYLHADAFLPKDWFADMKINAEKYDWFESPQRLTILVEYWNHLGNVRERAYSGAQMGNSEIMKKISSRIDDDYLQRNEDIILAELTETNGFTYGKVDNTFHYHQVMNRKGQLEPKFQHVEITKETDESWELRIFEKQYKGICKYLTPAKGYLVNDVNSSIWRILEIDPMLKNDIIRWISENAPEWKKHIRYQPPLFRRIVKTARRIFL